MESNTVKASGTNIINHLNIKTMNYLEQTIAKFHKNEITLEQLKNELHFIIDDVVIPDAVYSKEKGE